MDSKIIERVRALFALAKSDNEHEATAAMKQAMRLMERHRISEAEVASAQQSAGEEPICHDTVFVSEKRKVPWKIRLANSIARANACKAWTNPTNDKRFVQRIIGSTSDIEMVKVMFAWLVLTGEKLAHSGVRRRPEWLTAQKWKGDFLFGFAEGIGEQLLRAKEEVRAEAKTTSSAAIVLLVRQDERVMEVYKAMPGMRNMNLGPRNTSEGYVSGRIAGKNVHLGHALPGAKKQLTGLAWSARSGAQQPTGRNA
jgi:hypothetical protein